MSVSIVQFLHPGAEHSHRGPLVPWNSGDHVRKFVRSEATLFHPDGETSQEDAVFWCQWEPPSEVIHSYERPVPDGPRRLHRPLLEPHPGGVQGNDPLVFGQSFVYSNCQQIKRPDLASLQPGSVVLFGSYRGGQFLLDTCLVVAERYVYSPGLDHSELPPNQLFRDTTLSTLQDNPHARGEYLRYYRGRTPQEDRQFFSFVPALPASRAEGFARPTVEHPVYITPNLQRGAKHGRTSPSDAARVWQSVRDQVFAAGLCLAANIAEPTEPAPDARAFNDLFSEPVLRRAKLASEAGMSSRSRC